MNYVEAIKESLNRKWKVTTCSQGEECWCRVASCDPELHYNEDGLEEIYPFNPIGAGEVQQEIVEHLVKIHNENLK
jgi:hypothetical protein